MEFIEKYSNNWVGTYIYLNPNLTIEFIEKYYNKIEFKWLSTNRFTYKKK